MYTATQASQFLARIANGSWRDLRLLLADVITVYYGVTPGTATASKALVLDSSKAIGTITTLTVTTLAGVSAAQGAALTLAGGTSSTSANAGGALVFTGGTPGATGVGGAATIAAGAGGATSGNGGVASLTGGAGTLATATGGIGKVVGGDGSAGATTVPGGVGGKGQVLGGAGGAKAGTGAAAGGAGGNAEVTAGVGGATASSGSDAGGAGGTAKLAGGVGGAASAGTGNGGAGGDVDLIPAAGGASAGGTAGLKGEVKVNGDTKGFLPIGYNYSVPGALAFAFYIAPRAMRVKDIRGRTRVTGTGGACTATFFKAPSGTALGSGTALLASGSFNFVGTADTDQVMALSATASVLELAAGDAIGMVVTGTSTNATGCISITLAPT